MRDAEIDPKMLKTLIDAFDAGDWEEMTLTLPGGDGLHLSRNPDSASPATFAAPPAAPVDAAPAAISSSPTPTPTPAATEPGPASSSGTLVSAGGGGTDADGSDGAAGVPVASTTVGIFWVAPAPGAPPFVEVGDRVSADDTVGIVEVMKLMNHVPAGVDGVVTAVLVANGEAVEFGQTLALVDPQG
jgi:acetyl-CoA carboxylase biotin carboxyl carrier protein